MVLNVPVPGSAHFKLNCHQKYKANCVLSDNWFCPNQYLEDKLTFPSTDCPITDIVVPFSGAGLVLPDL